MDGTTPNRVQILYRVWEGDSLLQCVGVVRILTSRCQVTLASFLLGSGAASFIALASALGRVTLVPPVQIIGSCKIKLGISE